MARKPKTKKMVGTFCEKTHDPKETLDARSFRYKKSGKSWLLIACPKGEWADKKRWKRAKKVHGKTTYVWETGKCTVPTHLHKILTPLGKKTRCPKGSQRVTKRS